MFKTFNEFNEGFKLKSSKKSVNRSPVEIEKYIKGAIDSEKYSKQFKLAIKGDINAFKSNTVEDVMATTYYNIIAKLGSYMTGIVDDGVYTLTDTQAEEVSNLDGFMGDNTYSNILDEYLKKKYNFDEYTITTMAVSLLSGAKNNGSGVEKVLVDERKGIVKLKPAKHVIDLFSDLNDFGVMEVKDDFIVDYLTSYILEHITDDDVNIQYKGVSGLYVYEFEVHS